MRRYSRHPHPGHLLFGTSGAPARRPVAEKRGPGASLKLSAMLCGLLTMTAVAGPAAAQALEPMPGSMMWVDGTSTLHDWTVDVTTVKGRVAGDGETVESVQLEIPVLSMQSGKGGMDDKMYDALKVKRHPVIRVEGGGIRFSQPETTDSAALFADAEVDVTITGTTRTMPVRIWRDVVDGELSYTGQVTFRMSEFGVDPPQALMGTVRAGDEITLRFDVRTPLAETEEGTR